MVRELEILEQILTGPMRYMVLEEAVFEGDRLRMLRALKYLRSDGALVVSVAGRAAADWELAAWLRSPYSEQTKSDLELAGASITDKGAKMI